jgi:hypothetical protein
MQSRLMDGSHDAIHGAIAVLGRRKELGVFENRKPRACSILSQKELWPIL